MPIIDFGETVLGFRVFQVPGFGSNDEQVKTPEPAKMASRKISAR
jgi:hypothetical protein